MTPEVKAIVDKWWKNMGTVEMRPGQNVVMPDIVDIYYLATRIEAAVLAKQPTPTAGMLSDGVLTPIEKLWKESQPRMTDDLVSEAMLLGEGIRSNYQWLAKAVRAEFQAEMEREKEKAFKAGFANFYIREGVPTFPRWEEYYDAVEKAYAAYLSQIGKGETK
jgi:hypothetical protein